jgi:predicted nucleotidyltransferase component of viral defense system
MTLTGEQVKGKIKNISKTNKADARILMRIYMMERFLERLAKSPYSENFIIKGGILVTSMVGVSMRSTMDIDTSIRNINLSEKDALRVITEISEIDLHDGVIFKVKKVSGIMDEMEYPGIRIVIDAHMGAMITPIKIDISTGDIITPRAIEYDYRLMLEDRSIKLWSYNLETIFAEKLQTILSRGILNTRMRDFYDIYTLMLRYEDSIDKEVLKQAFKATCKKRNTKNLTISGTQILNSIMHDDRLNSLWNSYQQKYEYAREISFEVAIDKAILIYEMMQGLR